MSARVRWLVAIVVSLAIMGLPGSALSAATESTMLQVDPAHDGYVYGAGVVPPLAKVWYHDGGWQNGYVAIDSGHIFAFTHTAGSNPVTYIASLSLASGSIAWRTSVDSAEPSQTDVAVAGGRVFTVTDGGWPAGSDTDVIILSAFNESTGAKLWSEPLQNPGYQQWIPSALIASGATLYVEGGGYGGTVYAVNQSTGKQTWTTNTLMSSPVTLAGAVLVVPGECGLSSGLKSGSGAIEWTDNPGCSAGGSLTSSYDGTDVWAGDPADQGGGRVLNPATGAVVRGFTGYSPAFGYGEAVQVVPTSGDSDLEVRAFNPSTLATRWTFIEPGDSGNPLGFAPLLADGYVFVTGSYGKTWALNPCTGAVDWSGTTGKYAPMEGIDPLPGLAAGDGYLVVPNQRGLTAFKGSGTPTGAAPNCAS